MPYMTNTAGNEDKKTDGDAENEFGSMRRNINQLLRFRVESESARMFEVDKAEAIRKEHQRKTNPLEELTGKK